MMVSFEVKNRCRRGLGSDELSIGSALQHRQLRPHISGITDVNVPYGKPAFS
jgi:hypothetical protein